RTRGRQSQSSCFPLIERRRISASSAERAITAAMVLWSLGSCLKREWKCEFYCWQILPNSEETQQRTLRDFKISTQRKPRRVGHPRDQGSSRFRLCWSSPLRNSHRRTQRTFSRVTF